MTNGTRTSLQQVCDAEYEALERLSANADLQTGKIARTQLMGLALSGGGIRSATFNLGVLQALSELKLLKEFDYLSTVSGGGYIGSWLSAWIKRADEETHNSSEEQTKESGGEPRHKAGVERVQDLLSARVGEPKALRWLRSYSNYLTPQDRAAAPTPSPAVATYLRNSRRSTSTTLIVACLEPGRCSPRRVAASARKHRAARCTFGAVGTVGMAARWRSRSSSSTSTSRTSCQRARSTATRTRTASASCPGTSERSAGAQLHRRTARLCGAVSFVLGSQRGQPTLQQ